MGFVTSLIWEFPLMMQITTFQACPSCATLTYVLPQLCSGGRCHLPVAFLHFSCIRRVTAEHSGLLPVLSHSPYVASLSSISPMPSFISVLPSSSLVRLQPTHIHHAPFVVLFTLSLNSWETVVLHTSCDTTMLVEWEHF